MYTGHLYGWKGLILWHRQSPSSERMSRCFCGGTEKDIESFKGKYGNDSRVLIAGHKNIVKFRFGKSR